MRTSQSDVAVRPVEEGDVPRVVELITHVLAEFGLTFGEGSSTDHGMHGLPASYTDAGGGFWVAVRGDVILGTCGVYPVAPATFELRKMYLHDNARGLGLGKRMLDVAIEFTRAQGATRLVLDTVEEMKRAIAFYEANGFVRDDCQVRGERCTRGYVLVIQ